MTNLFMRRLQQGVVTSPAVLQIRLPSIYRDIPIPYYLTSQ